MREEKGPGRKINGLFHWISEDSLILHEVARAAGLEGRGYKKKVNSPCMKDMESTLGYSDFHNLMRFTSKKMPNNILKNVC